MPFKGNMKHLSLCACLNLSVGAHPHLLVPDDLHAATDLPHRLVDASQPLFDGVLAKFVHLMPFGHGITQLLRAMLDILQPSAVQKIEPG